MARTPFCSQVLCPVSFSSCVIQSAAKNPDLFLPRPLFSGRGSRRAQPPVGEGSAIQDATVVRRCLLFLLPSGLCVILERIPDPSLPANCRSLDCLLTQCR